MNTRPPLQIIDDLQNDEPRIQIKPEAQDDRIHDTAEITEIYLARPQSCMSQSLGIWFCNAHGLFDADMKLSASAQRTKKYLWMRGYTKFPLDPLLKYNQRMAKPGRE